MTTGSVTSYSGKPLYQKLGLKPGMTCLAIAAPDHYPALIADAEGVSVVTEADKAEVVHLFCRKARDLAAMAGAALSHVAKGGTLWVSWPKKSSPLFEDLTEDGLRDVLLPLGWVDVKVCAVDKDWSGMKFLKRRPKTG
ncbi:MAG: DUF3052 domain-containing protein [Rhizobiales bacterium]|nr:DUF3052 domain-containing protein [Hyphomicrobiales bacterium]